MDSPTQSRQSAQASLDLQPFPAGSMRGPTDAPGGDIARSVSLADLAARIRAEHEGVRSAIKRGIEHALKAGELLIEAKKRLDQHGQWMPWLRDHCAMSYRTAALYMRLAKNRETIEAQIATVANLSLNDAAVLLAKHRDEPVSLSKTQTRTY
jgi:hypothetical protein